MKHLPNELLYLLKVYNYIMRDIGLDRARSNSEKIREYIRNADFLAPFPTVLEYLSEDKSIDDIITYIQRNERTYSLLGEWKEREAAAILSEAGADASLCAIGQIELIKDKDRAYFTAQSGPCTEKRIVMKDADLACDLSIDSILWLELYRTKDGLCLEIFDDGCRTCRVSFSALSTEKVFYSALPLTEGLSKDFDAAHRLCAHLNEKASCATSLLNSEERELLPFIRLFALEGSTEWAALLPRPAEVFDEYSLTKGAKILNKLSAAENEKKARAHTKALARFLRSKKCTPLTEGLLKKLKKSQETVPTKA